MDGFARKSRAWLPGSASQWVHGLINCGTVTFFAPSGPAGNDPALHQPAAPRKLRVPYLIRRRARTSARLRLATLVSALGRPIICPSEIAAAGAGDGAVAIHGLTPVATPCRPPEAGWAGNDPKLVPFGCVPRSVQRESRRSRDGLLFAVHPIRRRAVGQPLANSLAWMAAQRGAC